MKEEFIDLRDCLRLRIQDVRETYSTSNKGVLEVLALATRALVEVDRRVSELTPKKKAYAETRNPFPIP